MHRQEIEALLKQLYSTVNTVRPEVWDILTAHNLTPGEASLVLGVPVEVAETHMAPATEPAPSNPQKKSQGKTAKRGTPRAKSAKPSPQMVKTPSAKRGRKKVEIPRKKLEKLLSQYNSLAPVARDLAVSTATVRARMQEYGITL